MDEQEFDAERNPVEAEGPNYLARARHLIDLNRASQAIPVLTDALREQPDDAEILATLSCAYLSCGDYYQALQWAERAIGQDPFEEYPHRLRAFTLLELNRKKEALASAREAVQLDPTGNGALLSLFLVQKHLRQWRDALATGKDLTELYPEDPDSHQARAEALLGLRRWRDAEQAAHDGLAIAPDSVRLRVGLARALWGQKREAESLQMYREAVLADPSSQLAQKALSEQVGNYLVPPSLALPWHLWACLTSFFCWSAHRILGWWTWWGLLWALVVLVWNTLYILNTDHWILRQRRKQYDGIPSEVVQHLWRAKAFSPSLLVMGGVLLMSLLTAILLILFTLFPRLTPSLPESPGLAFFYLFLLFVSVVRSLTRSGDDSEKIKFFQPLEPEDPTPAYASTLSHTDWRRYTQPRLENYDPSG